MPNQPDNLADRVLDKLNNEPTSSREELLQILYQLRQLTHEMAQPLTTILGLAEFIGQHPALDSALVEDVQLLIEETETLKGKFNFLQQLLRVTELGSF